MLPQIGFIVAQAGADSIHPPNMTNPNMLQRSSQLSKSYPPAPPPTTSNEQTQMPYYTRHPSPPSTSTPLLPPLPYMYNSLPPPPPPPPPSMMTREYYPPPFDSNQQQYRSLQPLPPQTNYGNYNPVEGQFWQPPTYQSTTSHGANNGVTQTTHDNDYVDQTHRKSWSDSNSNKSNRRIREFNDLMSWMDNEYWEQRDELYREKLQSLQDEIKLIQEGTHTTFQDAITDIEFNREQTIQNAQYFKDYELSLIQVDYNEEKSSIEEIIEKEKVSLRDKILKSIEDKRKQIKDNKHNGTFDAKQVFPENKSSKRDLRGRANFHGNNHRQDRRRQNRYTPYDINAPPTTAEEAELEDELVIMKGGQPTRRTRR